MDADAFFAIGVLPINSGLIFGQWRTDIAVHLVFDVEKFGGIEPDAGIVSAGHGRLHHIIGNGFAHHAPGVPDRFDGFAARTRLPEFGAVAYGIHVGNIALQKFVYENALFIFNAAVV